MAFLTDQQTLDDLNIFGKYGTGSLYEIFNRTLTRSGAKLLENWFRFPLSDAAAIHGRIRLIRHFAEAGTVFPFATADLDLIVTYLENQDERSRLLAHEQSVGLRLGHLLAPDAELQTIHKGIVALVSVFSKLRQFIASAEMVNAVPYASERLLISKLLDIPGFAQLQVYAEAQRWTSVSLAEADALLRFSERERVLQIMEHLYALDVYLAVARVGLEQGFNFPEPVAATEGLKLEGLYHPQLKNAVANSITIETERNLVFLTGANMAGKSTFMKSISLALYLAHMGFPVAAKRMKFPVLDGIYTTINLPDDLGMGASHFYAEVLRAKKVALELRNRRLFVVFDELFRGTNVKDACEASIAFSKAFAAKKGSMFLLSTHIIEAGEALREAAEPIQFVYLPTLMQGQQPLYTYQLKEGITADRHGMLIIRNEHILEQLEAGKLRKESNVQQQFKSDKQSLSDLNLLGKYKAQSIYSLFNRVQTAGGERLLQEMFQQPLSDADVINSRSRHFQFFQAQACSFPCDKEQFALAEQYLTSGTSDSFLAETLSLGLKKLQHSFLHDEVYGGLQRGLLASINMLDAFRKFLLELPIRPEDCYEGERDRLLRILQDPRLETLKAMQGGLSFGAIVRGQQLLKRQLQKPMEELLEGLYRLDVYIHVGQVARENGFSYAHALPRAGGAIRSSALWHPRLPGGIANPVSLGQEQNMIFLTGANMAGKSTFMKAVGIAVYLAHMGFPVAARDMEFPILDGLYSSINVSDDLDQGYSHYYAEVLRVKKVAEEVSKGKHLLLLFDELFKGTNVKDAYDATLAVSESFSDYRDCFFIISTHIIEVGEALQKSRTNLDFKYMPTILEGQRPRYTYRLQAGITSDRQGMMIIAQEGILDILA